MDDIPVLYKFSDGAPSNIVKLPWRKYPGILIQGDTMSSYLSLIKKIHKIASDIKDDEVLGVSEELMESFQDQLDIYEAILKDQEIRLPYEK